MTIFPCGELAASGRQAEFLAVHRDQHGLRLDFAVQPSRTNGADRRDEGDARTTAEGDRNDRVPGLRLVGLGRSAPQRDGADVGFSDADLAFDMQRHLVLPEIRYVAEGEDPVLAL